jgi:hypothetical protein
VEEGGRIGEVNVALYSSFEASVGGGVDVGVDVAALWAVLVVHGDGGERMVMLPVESLFREGLH